MKQPLNEYMNEHHAGSVAAMARAWNMPESTLHRMLKSMKPIFVYDCKKGKYIGAILRTLGGTTNADQ